MHKRLNFLGPDFKTTFTHRGSGKPDLIFANRAFNIFHHHLAPGPLSGSDHIPVIMTISTNPILIPTTPRYNYTQADWDTFKQTLTEHEYITDYEGKHHTEIEEQCTHLHNTIINTANDTIPKTTYKPFHSFTPSIRTQRLLVCYRRRFELNKHNFRQVRFDLSHLQTHILNSLESDHNKHWLRLIQKTTEHRKTNPWEFWRNIRKLKGTKSPRITTLIINDREISDPREITNILKNTWEPVYHPNPIHPNAARHIRNIEQHLNTIRQNTTPDTNIHLNNLDPHNALTAPISVDEVGSLLAKTPRKTPGATGIGRHILTHLPDTFITALTHLYNAALASGYFPETFKRATVTFIPKKQKQLTDPLNFRPISLLETIGKTFERIINNRLRTHLEDNDLLSHRQFAFRSGRSTQDALNLITNYTYINYNTIRPYYKTALITRDVKRAFDSVWHAGLKHKICQQFQLPLAITKLLCNYLDNRTMRIKFHSNYSDYFRLNAGVPQGSVLAPTLYNLYTTDIPNPRYNDTLTVQYADDITQLIRSTTLDRLTTKAGLELAALTDWERKWRIQVNPLKSSVTYFKIKSQTPRHLFQNWRDPDRAPLPITKQCTVLGVTYDNQLRFHKHITQKTAIANQSLLGLYRFRGADPRTKLHLYKALIRPLITYAPLSISLSAKSNTIKFQRIQNKATRWALGIRWDDFQTSSSIHDRCRLSPINIYLHNLHQKQITKLIDTHPDFIDLFTAITPQNRLHLNLFHNLDARHIPDPIFT